MPTTVSTPGLVLAEHEFRVPLDHAQPDGEQLTVFAREVSDPDGRDRPYLVFLQGGPGFEAPRPTRHPSGPGWLDRALEDFRVLMVDQRGTGRSSPSGVPPGQDAQAQAAYLTHFRADAIVDDCEWIRRALAVPRWSILGQSFGGFCATRYLSQAPDGLREAFITGGLPALGHPVDDAYRHTYARAIDRSRRYYNRYPADRDRVRDLQRRADAGEVVLPSGDRLTARRVRQWGMELGASDGAERLHYLLELPVDFPAFLHDADSLMQFGRDPIYALLQEACWADGAATRWSAHRLLPDVYEAEPELFFGEHVFPWLFEDFGALAPLRDAAELLAEHIWPRLYDRDQLAANEVPVAAAIYAEDMYVERALSEETAAQIRGLKPWITNEYQHNGLRADGAAVLSRLIDLATRAMTSGFVRPLIASRPSGRVHYRPAA